MIRSVVDRVPSKDLCWLLRIWVGVMMMYHGYGALFGNGLADFASHLEGLGMPYPHVLAALAKGGEFFGGLALIIGNTYIHRLALLLIAVVMFVAAFIAHKGLIWTEGELAFLYLLACVVLFFNPGPSIYELGKKWTHA